MGANGLLLPVGGGLAVSNNGAVAFSSQNGVGAAFSLYSFLVVVLEVRKARFTTLCTYVAPH